jgi:hypothetical protein
MTQKYFTEYADNSFILKGISFAKRLVEQKKNLNNKKNISVMLKQLYHC